MGDTYPRLRAGVVQAAPVFLNREATVDRACKLIREAGRGGARLLAFPEGFIPGHPLWYHFHAASGHKSTEFADALFKNALQIPGPDLDTICQAARDAEIYVFLGCCEKTPTSTGTMYNTLVAIDPRGHVIGKRRKITPTLGERLVHASGFGDSVRVFETEFGPVSGLICGENSNPLLVFGMQALGARIHVASWPSHFNHHYSMPDVIPMVTRAIAYQTGAFVLNSVGGISEQMIEMLPLTDEDREFLVRSSKLGGASIIGPSGAFIAGPMIEGEGILYADLDLDKVIRRRIVQDFGGHYNRPDIFTLKVNHSAPELLESGDAVR